MRTDSLKAHDILLYQGSRFVSRLIQWGTKSPYSHVAVVVDPEIYLGIESNTGSEAGVRALDLRKLEEGVVDIFRVKPEFSFEGREVISFLVARLGAKYDYGGVAGLGVMKLASALTGFKTLTGYNRFQRERDYFCSELVYEAFTAGGLDIVPQIGEAEITSPADIARSPRIECLHRTSECREKVTQGGNR